MKRILLALTATALAGPALAFDEVHWEWNLEVETDVSIDVDVEADLSPTGFQYDESFQLFIGDVEAEASMTDIQNTGSGLPSAQNTASASGAYLEVYSEVPINYHAGQIVVGGIAGGEIDYEQEERIAPAQGDFSAAFYGQNHHHSHVHLLALADFFGVVTPAEITAEAIAGDYLNSGVDNVAQAVGANALLEIRSDTPANRFMVADIQQGVLANVTATAEVDNIDIGSGYASPSGPLFRNVANAAGTSIRIVVRDEGAD